MTEQITSPTDPGTDIEIKSRKRWPWALAAAGVVAVIVGGLVFANYTNQDKPFGPDLEVATWSTDIAAENLLSYIAENVAPEHGITIKPVKIDNLIEINRAVDAGNVAGNFFEHQPFLNDAIAANGFQLTLAAPTFTWDQATYSNSYRSWDQLPSGAKIALRDDPAGQAIALLDLAQAGQITLKPGKDTVAGLPQLSDVASNPKNYQFVQVPIGQLARSLADVDAVVVHISDVYAAGLTEDQILARHPAPKGSEGGLVVSNKHLDDPNVQKLIETFKDPKIADFLQNTDNKLIRDTLGPIS
ncbi:NLPA lipoprotein [Mycolicibacterium mageritense DSM 44476 = CIP 104973]|uniref:Metal ABC transporter substrate-binding protein n=1 Tax=Mycolicibacterium mageritense TaxID=53462 RepID=A0AAI8U1W0_MYCME|nr:MetQ/NlpA family ABC transporter substrate-binding protein [Mycolicibacterium mageritense]OKH66852.1 metal ABC transporter substrate-binding protein [Mycobacterium sp. SWH-M3]MCC9182697.1 MetQ/NlpA family ABC transporter substrate-binding protein [Mycolicibacterium mageritense]TXI65525.1 MAG: metal ABC transporter substrate-binding protein [Mycolicibacterium mageritense]CDO26937.1 NLPA lipoprotein [Mycolicibacterium mageritense DSM 44476 = CIP 104973]BBX38330.1 metal ABC transporter substra